MISPSCPNEACIQSIGSPAKVVRHGFFRVRCGRRRRYRCRGCGRTFSARTNTPYFGLGCSSRAFERVAHLSVEGMSCAAIARVEGIAWHTADRWLAIAAGLAQQFNERHVHGIPLIELQADELRTFAPCKAKPTWVFTSMEVCSRLWSSTVVGRRSYANTKALFSDTLLRGEVIGTPLIITDGFKFYERVIRRLFGVVCIYAQVIKTWRKNRVTRVECRAVIGTTSRLERALDESEDSAHANTAYIERLNLTIRQSVAYLRRRSPSHARCERRLHRQLELARCHYNFIRRHTGLRFGRELQTPAMVAGLRDRVCSFRDVFAFAYINSE